MWSRGKNKIRLDQFLVENNYLDDIQIAQAHILRGNVLLDDIPVYKSGHLISLDKKIPDIRIRNIKPNVSRGYNKLKEYFKNISPDLSNTICFDLGCGPGGFSQVMLEYDASKIVMVDVGCQIVDNKLRSDPKIHVLERTNIKSLFVKNFQPKLDHYDLFWDNREKSDHPNPNGKEEQLLPAIDINSRITVVSDVSFISLKEFLSPVFEFSLICDQNEMEFFLLLKPQFELPKEIMYKFPGGIVSDIKFRKIAILEFFKFLKKYNIYYNDHLTKYFKRKKIRPDSQITLPFHFFIKDIAKSKTKGRAGNQEYFININLSRKKSGLQLSKKTFRFLLNLR
jgi:23S rRNA (cytidine1920-2'-O)/16S rRNA (cytidine1409-2'-O)-methyltransferase